MLQGLYVEVLRGANGAPLRMTDLSNSSGYELGFGGAEEVGQEAVAGGFDAGAVFYEGNAHYVEIEADGGAGAFETGHGIGHEQKFRADAAFDAISATLGAADELVA